MDSHLSLYIVYVYIYIYTAYLPVYFFTWTNRSTHIHTRTHTHECVCVCVLYAYIDMDMDVDIDTGLPACLPARLPAHLRSAHHAQTQHRTCRLLHRLPMRTLNEAPRRYWERRLDCQNVAEVPKNRSHALSECWLARGFSLWFVLPLWIILDTSASLHLANSRPLEPLLLFNRAVLCTSCRPGFRQRPWELGCRVCIWLWFVWPKRWGPDRLSAPAGGRNAWVVCDIEIDSCK